MPTRLSWTPAALIVLAGSAQAFAAGPFPASFDLSSLDGTNGFVLSGIDAYNRSGLSVSSAGDFNGDGVDDLVIGAPGDPLIAPENAGESYVVFGGPGLGAGGTLNLSALNGANGFVLNGIDLGDRSGYSVSSAGDVNADGIDDLIIGAYGADPNGQTDAGECYVVFGAADLASSGSIELASLDGANGFMLQGFIRHGHLGRSVSSAGDLNADGIDDISIGAGTHDPGHLDSGYAYVVFGRPTCIADLNADRRTDVLDFAVLLHAFGATPAHPSFNPAADLDHNDNIDVFDFGIFALDFGCPD